MIENEDQKCSVMDLIDSDQQGMAQVSCVRVKLGYLYFTGFDSLNYLISYIR
jgi:hypothetical protein